MASWSSIDYIGNWKALHFSAKKFFNPVLVSGLEDKDNLTVEIHLSNDTLEEKKGKVQWKLMNLSGKLEDKGEFEAKIAANISAKIHTLDLAEAVKKAGGIREVVFFYSFISDGKEISSNTTYFERPKHMKLQAPDFETNIRQINAMEYEVTIKSDKPALWVWPDVEEVTAKYSDRFFDLDGKDVKVLNILLTEYSSLDDIGRKLKVRSLFDTYGL